MDTVKTQTRAEFLLARIAEDEAVARAEDEEFDDTTLLPTYDSDHQWRWNTAHVLIECKAKRLRLKIADDLEAEADDNTYRWAHSVAEQIRKAEALPYAGHADYREEWRP